MINPLREGLEMTKYKLGPMMDSNEYFRENDTPGSCRVSFLSYTTSPIRTSRTRKQKGRHFTPILIMDGVTQQHT